ncbi:MAG: hypothetical protein R3F17_13115 [Planctomycetota bacterium]
MQGPLPPKTAHPTSAADGPEPQRLIPRVGDGYGCEVLERRHVAACLAAWNRGGKPEAYGSAPWDGRRFEASFLAPPHVGMVARKESDGTVLAQLVARVQTWNQGGRPWQVGFLEPCAGVARLADGGRRLHEALLARFAGTGGTRLRLVVAEGTRRPAAGFQLAHAGLRATIELQGTGGDSQGTRAAWLDVPHLRNTAGPVRGWKHDRDFWKARAASGATPPRRLVLLVAPAGEAYAEVEPRGSEWCIAARRFGHVDHVHALARFAAAQGVRRLTMFVGPASPELPWLQSAGWQLRGEGPNLWLALAGRAPDWQELAPHLDLLAAGEVLP